MQWKFIQHNEVFIAYQPNRYHRCRLTTTLRWNGIYLTWPIKKPILCSHITMHVRCKLSKGHHLLGVIYATQKVRQGPEYEHQAPLSAILHKQPLSKLPQRHACNHWLFHWFFSSHRFPHTNISRFKFLMTTSDLAPTYTVTTLRTWPVILRARYVLLFINYQTRKKSLHRCCKLDIGRAVICCPSIYRAMIGYSNIRRAFRWHKNIYRGIRFIPVLSIAFHRVEIKRTLKALYMRHT